MDMKDFIKGRKKAQRSAASDDAKKRGHVDKFTGKPYGTEEAASRRKDIHTPEKKPSRDAARDAAGGVTGHGGPLKAKKVRKAKAMGELGEGVDIFDAVLEYLVAEGYAATNKEALVIMANMSEEWRSEIVEAYVDYRKGKLPSGRTPQQAAQGREKLLNARAAAGSEKDVSKSPATDPVTSGDVATSIRNRDRRERQSQRTQEMDSETGLAARVYKALPGAPRMKNEPNTERHYQAMQKRKIASNLRSAEKESRG